MSQRNLSTVSNASVNNITNNPIGITSVLNVIRVLLPPSKFNNKGIDFLLLIFVFNEFHTDCLQMVCL